jgi:hypothetical protein
MTTTMTVALARVAELRASEPAKYGTQELLAKATGLHQTTWSGYLRGKARPGRHERKILKRRLGIAPESWDMPCDVLTNDHMQKVTVDRSSEFSQAPADEVAA